MIRYIIHEHLDIGDVEAVINRQHPEFAHIHRTIYGLTNGFTATLPLFVEGWGITIVEVPR